MPKNRGIADQQRGNRQGQKGKLKGETAGKVGAKGRIIKRESDSDM